MSTHKKIPREVWQKYLARLRAIDEAATNKMFEWLNTLSQQDAEAIIAYAYALATKYGEASAALAAEMYDAIADISGKLVPAAVPATTATYKETGDALKKALQSKNPKLVANETGKLVKTAGVDTTMQNAIRDGAEWAWITVGDTCAFCITLASRGWQPASKKAIKGNHARHIHANCDCTYMIRFGGQTNIVGYDPDVYRDAYLSAAGGDSSQKINSMRRRLYAENRDKINAQKRAAYRERVNRNAENNPGE